jgi:hypothetical protein
VPLRPARPASALQLDLAHLLLVVPQRPAHPASTLQLIVFPLVPVVPQRPVLLASVLHLVLSLHASALLLLLGVKFCLLFQTRVDCIFNAIWKASWVVHLMFDASDWVYRTMLCEGVATSSSMITRVFELRDTVLLSSNGLFFLVSERRCF